MRYTKSALGLLNAQYRSVLKKCLMINLGLFALAAISATPANADNGDLTIAIGGAVSGTNETSDPITVNLNELASASDVDDLKTTVGSATSGLVKDVADLKTTVGSATSGLVKDVAGLQTAVGSNTSGSETGIYALIAGVKSTADGAVQSVVEGSTNGTISVDGTDVAVHGLGSAAYTASTAYATSTQGSHADDAYAAAVTNKATTVASGNTNLVTSGAVYTAVSAKQDTIDSTHKLDADLIKDGTTNKVSDWNQAVSDVAILKADASTTGSVAKQIADATSGMLTSSNYSTTLDSVYAKSATLQAVATSGAAGDVSYSNTSSGLTAANVQGAIDELASGKQDTIDGSHKLSADYIQDGTTNKVVTATEKSTWNAKQEQVVAGSGITLNADKKTLSVDTSVIQAKITSTSKLDADLVDDSTSTNKFVTATDKTTWNAKQEQVVAGSGITLNADKKTLSVDTSVIQAKLANATNGGDGIAITDSTGAISVDIKSGDGLKFDTDGKLTVDSNVYKVKDVGTGLSNSSGTISVSGLTTSEFATGTVVSTAIAADGGDATHLASTAALGATRTAINSDIATATTVTAAATSSANYAANSAVTAAVTALDGALKGAEDINTAQNTSLNSIAQLVDGGSVDATGARTAGTALTAYDSATTLTGVVNKLESNKQENLVIATDSGLAMAGDGKTLSVKLKENSGLVKDGSGVAVNLGDSLKFSTTGKIDINANTSEFEITTSNGLNLKDGGVTVNKIANGAVTTDKIGANAVTDAKIAEGAVINAKLAANAVTTDKIANGTIKGEDMEDGAVDTDQLAAGAVTHAKLADNAVDTNNIAAGAVTHAKLADNAVDTNNIVNSAVTTAKIADANVTFAKLSADSYDTTGAAVAAGSDNVLATGKTVKLGAENADFTVGSTKNIGASNNTINKAITALDTAIGDRSAYTAENNIAKNEAVATSLDKLDVIIGKISTLDESNGNLDKTSVAASLTAIDGTLGNVKALDGDSGTQTKNLAPANSTVADHLTAINNRLGQIDGLNAKRGADAKGNLATNSTVEDHLVALDDAIGDRNNYTNQNVISNGQSVAESLDSLDTKVGELDRSIYRIDNEVSDLKHDFRTGMASVAALSALVPNARSEGNTSLSFGTGAYQGHTAMALGGFHYINDNILLNAGVAWGNSHDAVYRMGVTYSW